MCYICYVCASLALLSAYLLLAVRPSTEVLPEVRGRRLQLPKHHCAAAANSKGWEARRHTVYHSYRMRPRYFRPRDTATSGVRLRVIAVRWRPQHYTKYKWNMYYWDWSVKSFSLLRLQMKTRNIFKRVSVITCELFLTLWSLQKDILTVLSLSPYIYGHFASRDWYSGDTHAARMRGSMFDPRCDRCNILLFHLARSQMQV